MFFETVQQWQDKEKYLNKISLFTSSGHLEQTNNSSHQLQKYPLISCQSAMKENPRKSPRDPPNSATKEVNG